MTRNKCFDQIKGILILLVIIGHVLLGSLDQNIARAVIYFFHMPLFLAISGYFISQKTLNLSLNALLHKYWHRMLLPFIIALLVYSLAVSHNPLSPYPYYHLWYIPAVMLFIFYLKGLERIKSIASLYYPIMLLFIGITVFFETYSQWGLSEHWLYKMIGDKRFYYFFSYFALGYMLAQNKKRISAKYVALWILPLIFLNQMDIYFINGLTKVAINFAFIYLAILYCETAQHSTAQHSTAQHSTAQHSTAQHILDLIGNIGRISLPIYLWHVLPIILLKRFIPSEIIYYSANILLFSIFILALLKLEDKSKWLNKLLYGK